MSDYFHRGELAVQAQAGVRHQAEKLQSGFHPELPGPAQRFLAQQQLAVASSLDAEGRAWAAPLSGPPGFLRVRDAQTIVIDGSVPADDPLLSQLVEGAPLGLVVIDLAERRRVRVNGRVALQPDGRLGLAVERAYANCPKYIQARELVAPPTAVAAERPARHSAELSAEQQRWISAADTFFVASYHPHGGADASHRGGRPGFVAAHSSTLLSWPDYAGNGLFNTLGNLVEQPRAGLLFIDFASGSTLQISGRATVTWDVAALAARPGAERLVSFTVERSVERAGALPGGWALRGYSPFNP